MFSFVSHSITTFAYGLPLRKISPRQLFRVALYITDQSPSPNPVNQANRFPRHKSKPIVRGPPEHRNTLTRWLIPNYQLFLRSRTGYAAFARDLHS